MYYLRTRAAADAIKFTVDQQALAKNKAARAAKLAITNPVTATPNALKVACLYLPLYQFKDIDHPSKALSRAACTWALENQL